MNNYVWIAVIVICLIICCYSYFYSNPNNNPNHNSEEEEIEGFVSFQKDIRPLFRMKDVNSMRSRFDLSNYNDVKKYSNDIYRVVKEGKMPCDVKWDSDKVALFKKWIDTGMQQ